MSNSFAALKRNRQNQFDKLNEQLQKLNSPSSEKKEDTRFWKPDVDKAGNGLAIIRFLPAPEGEDLPYVRVWDHGFQGPGGWYIEKSLTTLGQKDPVSEYNTKLWATGTKEAQAQVRKQKRRLYFISNIYVVKDPAHPENEGKVFLYQYGKKIFDKLNMLMNPEFGEDPINPFDLWEGANFKLKIRNVEGYRNYDSSVFESAAPLMDDDDELEALWKQEHSLQAFVDPKEFKSYEELEAKLHKVLGLDGSAPRPQTTAESSKLPWEDDEPTMEPPKQKTAKAATAPVLTAAIGDDEDEDLEMFKKLLDD